MILFHYCETYLKKLEKENFKEEIDKKLSELSKRQNLEGNNIKPLGSGLYLLKHLRSPIIRVIIEEQTIDIDNENIRVYFVRDIYSNDYEYTKVQNIQLKNKAWLSKNPLPIEDRDKFISNYKKKKIEDKNKPSKSSSPDDVLKWLDTFKIKLDNQIFETEDWVKYTLSNSLSDGMQDNFVESFRIAVRNAVEKDEGSTLKNECGIEIKECIYEENIGILYSKITLSDEHKDVWLLFNGARINKQKEYWEKAKKNLFIDFDSTEESISRKAFRSYPKWTLNDPDLWFNIQKSQEESNLSLTQEQLDFLHKFKFPYYISGQAGSGKSTMLYYIFAEIYYYKCQDEIKGDIIFLTENEILLEHTKKCVYDLLTNNGHFRIEDREWIEKSQEKFKSFKHFLLDILPEEDREKFPDDKYLDFSKFKYLYENSNLSASILQKYSAEEVWFTITTYIYGYELDKQVSSNEYYDVIPRKMQIIPKNKFENIEKSVLPFYEKLINEQQYWDKLKIIKYITHNIQVEKKYSVIICDEAQDFCRVELEFILKMSEFLEYDLSNINQVPVLFAGDPNQTVNPTGFRESQITSLLYEMLKKAKFNNYKHNESIYTPIFNYRSTQSVVSLANYIQYYRKKKLQIEAKLQKAKRIKQNTNNTNVFLDYDEIKDNTELKNDLVKKLQYKIFIVPIDSHEKDDFKTKHKELLSELNEVEVKTSIEAKGAEYEQVVLYGFGEYFIQHFGDVSDKINESEFFKIGYFYNKLYVGITRAKTELIIIDSKKAKEEFWKKLVSNNVEELDKYENVILYNPGSIKDKIADSNEDNALKNAEQDKNQGVYDKNPARLRVAANQFFRIGKKEQYYECMAIAEEIKENWLGAVEYYTKMQVVPKEKVSECLFKGRKFDELETKTGKLQSVEHDIRVAISRIMQNEIIGSKEIDTLKQNMDKVREIVNGVTWRKDIINQLIITAKRIELIEQKRDFVQVLEKIGIYKDDALWYEIGNIRFELKEYKEAIDAWGFIDDDSFDSYFQNNEKYTLAQIEVSKQNNEVEKTIQWLDDLIKYRQSEANKINSEIIQLYLTNENKKEFSLEGLKIILKSILIVQNDKIDNKIVDLLGVIEKNSQSELRDLIPYLKNLIDNYPTEKDKNILVFLIERWAKLVWKKNKLNTDTKWLDKLNTKYLEITKKAGVIYKEFGAEELKYMPDFPLYINLTPNIHFNNIRIINFRQFRDFSLTDIGKYNLIVGDNNVGKTSLLEALSFDLKIKNFIENLTYAYIHRNNLPVEYTQNQEKYRISPEFIFDFFNKNAKQKEIQFILTQHRNQWIYKLYPVSNEKYDCLYFAYEHLQDKYKFEISAFLEEISLYNSIKSPLIPFGKGFGKDLARVYYREIEKIKEQRERFLENMKIFIPKIHRIHADTEKGSIDIEEEDSGELSPLHQYGDGANKLFRILVQITLQKNNKLLIDEIDAGIHFSHFPDFWKTILSTASRNNVQIFATTHNIECVKYFAQILKEENFSKFQSDCKIITLRQLPNNTIVSFTRPFNEFEYELENDFEIRGGSL